MRRLIFAATLFFSGVAYPQATDDLWLQVLHIKNFAAAVKASIRPGCMQDNPLSAIQSYMVICPKLEIIPNNVIEMAALPYVKLHLREELAHQVIAFSSSPRGDAIEKKILIELESGEHNQLTEEDLCILDAENKSPYGLALSALAKDKDASAAIIRAMFTYEP